MKFLIDHQLPPKLCLFFQERGYESLHVSDIGIETETDRFIWKYAHSEGLDLVSKDEDFFYLAAEQSEGPRLIWVRLGNCSSTALKQAFERLWPQIQQWMGTNDRVVEIR